jgi:hypothetical protein
VLRTVTRANPGYRRSRGLRVSVLVRTDDDLRNGYDPDPVATGLAFPGPAAPEGGTLVPSARGYRYPWREAGQAVGRLVLEALNHRGGALPDGATVDLAPAVRSRTNR